jgi:predicted RNA-binding protein YlxR (DUF448 family)
VDGGDRVGPRRTCIGCRRTATPGELVRLARGDDGDLLVGRRHPGRGAWLHPDPACVAEAGRRRAFGRALRGDIRAAAIVAIGEEITSPTGTLEGRTDGLRAEATPTHP